MMNNNRSISRLQIPAITLPSTPSPVRRPNLEPISWSRSPVLRRPSNETNVLHPSSLSSLRRGQHFLPPANNTSLLTATQGYVAQSSPSPQSYERIGFSNPYQQSIDRTESNDSGLGTGCSSADSKDSYYGSILKKQNNTNGNSTEGTLRRSQQRDANRKVVFKNSVSVYWYDSDAESACSPTERERFNLESSDRRLCSEEIGQGSSPMTSELCGESGRRGVQRGSFKTRQELPCTGNAQNFRDCTPTAPPGSPVGVQRKQTILPQLVFDKRTSFCATPRCSTTAHSAQLSFVQDQVTFRRKLVVAIQLSPELHPYDVLVKANKNGNKIRVVISKDTSLGNGIGVNEHISLPVEVDPYQLSARLGRDGVLHVEAPVIS